MIPQKGVVGTRGVIASKQRKIANGQNPVVKIQDANTQFFEVFSLMHATLQPVLSVCLSVSRSVCHATKVAVYPALFDE